MANDKFIGLFRDGNGELNVVTRRFTGFAPDGSPVHKGLYDSVCESDASCSVFDSLPTDFALAERTAA